MRYNAGLCILIRHDELTPEERHLALMKRKILLVLLVFPALLVAACGSTATPVPNAETRQAEQETFAAQTEEEGEALAAEPTVTSEPTETLVPPTATATDIPPSSTPTEAPATATPTELPPTETPAESEQSIAQLVEERGDPARGEELFNAMFSTASGSFMCATCHRTDSDERLIGPGMLTLSERAGQRVEGESAVEYIYNSIVDPSAYVVQDYPDALMPQNYAEILEDQDIYDLIAYLMSLGEE